MTALMTSVSGSNCRKPAVNRQLWATANGGRHKAMRPGRGVAEWHMLPSWNSLHTLLVARAVLLWHGASYPVLRCSSLARHPDLGPPTVPCARRPLFWYPIPVRIGSPTGDAWLTCQCASQSACSAFHNIRRLSLPSRVGEGTLHTARHTAPFAGFVYIYSDGDQKKLLLACSEDRIASPFS